MLRKRQYPTLEVSLSELDDALANKQQAHEAKFREHIEKANQDLAAVKSGMQEKILALEHARLR